MKTIYIAGPVTGHDIYLVRTRFANAQKALEEQGFIVRNPVEEMIAQNESMTDAGIEPVSGWQSEMRVAIKWMLDCDELAMLANWQESKGARLERDLAVRLGMPVMYL